MTAAAMAATSCGSEHNDEPKPPTPAKTERTLLVYMVANNDLGSRGWDDADITEMRTAAATGGLGNGRLLVMHQAPGGQCVLKEINSEGKTDTLRIYDSAEPSVSIRMMRNVFDDMRAYAPADDYGLVLWSHGTGWLEDGMTDNGNKEIKRAFGLDGNKQMNVTALAKALDGQDFSFVYFDCCYMASVEVAYELRHATPAILASVTELPLGGMPYDENVPVLLAHTPNLAAAAANTFRYYDNMSGSGRTCTISVINTGALDRLAAATHEIYAAATPLPEGYMPQAFERGGTCRHYDLADYVEHIASDPEALDRWNKALDDAVSYAAATPMIFNTLTIRRHCGLSTYVAQTPDDMHSHGYDRLQWADEIASALPWLQQ